ncbi:DUF2142 domain-containing protein [Microbacteriaceae bacterium VKM Ac-2854]|nr:DUF2142 domain-containing protein [Microbacteriaceae bacterium VKM Ac-2854]
MKSRWVVLFAAWGATFLIALSWTLGTPVSGAPDEPSHIVKAAASARGMWTGTIVGVGVETFPLPANIGDTGGDMTCFAFHPELDAGCAGSLDDAGSATIDAISGVGSYNPLYYALVGWPSLFLTGTTMVLAMRIVSALIVTFFFAVIVYAIAQLDRGRAVAVTAVAVGFTPMAGYLSGVLSPSGLEVAGVGAVAALSWLLATSKRALPVLEITVLLAGTVALTANLRATSPLFVVLAVAPAVIRWGWRPTLAYVARRSTMILAIAAALAAVLGLVWSLRIGLEAGFIPSSNPGRDGLRVAFQNTLLSFPSYFRELVGVFGWLDTRPPDWVFTVWAALGGAALLPALVVLRGRSLAAVLLALTTLIVLPAAIQAPTVFHYGYIWSGRYSLPTFVALLVAVGFAVAETVPDSARALTRRGFVLVQAIALVAGVAAAFTALKRVAVGDALPLSALFTGIGWQPPVPWPVILGVYLVGALGLAAVLGRLAESRFVPSVAEASTSGV